MRVAFVGHGPSLYKAGRGAEIDSYDIVVRLHDCHWQVPADHGSRYDIGILPGPWLSRAEKQIVTRPVKGYLVYCWSAPKGRLPERARLVDVGSMRKALMKAGARCRVGTPAPTRGLAAVEMIASTIRPKRIEVFGCDALMGGTAVNYGYHSAIGPMTEDTGRRHDMAAERKVIEWIARRYQVEIVG